MRLDKVGIIMNRGLAVRLGGGEVSRNAFQDISPEKCPSQPRLCQRVARIFVDSSGIEVDSCIQLTVIWLGSVSFRLLKIPIGLRIVGPDAVALIGEVQLHDVKQRGGGAYRLPRQRKLLVQRNADGFFSKSLC